MDDRIAGWVLALAISTALVVVTPRPRRGYAYAAAALLLLYIVALAAAGVLLDSAWRALAPAVAAIAVWLVVQPLLALGRLARSELGLTAPRAESVKPALAVTTAALVANALLVTARGAQPLAIAPTFVVYGVIAAMVEELVMRGAILALADRAQPPQWTIAGARVGVGGIVVTAAFVALHGVRPGLLIGVAPAAILYLWLRARTGSLLPPIVAHVLWNLSVMLLHR